VPGRDPVGDTTGFRTRSRSHLPVPCNKRAGSDSDAP
jgi:hypothetical protein